MLDVTRDMVIKYNEAYRAAVEDMKGWWCIISSSCTHLLYVIFMDCDHDDDDDDDNDL